MKIKNKTGQPKFSPITALGPLRMERVNFQCMKKVLQAAKELDQQDPDKMDEDGAYLFASIHIIECWLNRHEHLEDNYE